MMDFITIAKTRCSIRSYTEQKVEPEKLAKIGKAAGIYGAPLAIIVCADHNKAWVRPFDQKQTGDICDG